MLEVTQDFVERFWARVDVRGPDECWLWKGGKGSTGSSYGRVSISHSRSRPAHQIAWEIANGLPFPIGKVGCHRCDNPSCVNPAHIWPGTQSDNLRDCVAKGRHKAQKLEKCKRGHDLTGDNRIVNLKGDSRCRECSKIVSRETSRRWREKNRVQPPSQSKLKAWSTRRAIYGELGHGG